MACTISDMGGTRQWSDAITWVGGVVPTVADDVIATATSGDVIVSVGSVCNSLDLTAYTGTLSSPGALGSGTLVVSGSLALGGTISYTGVLTLNSASSVTITTNAVALNVLFNIGGTGTFTHADSFTNSYQVNVLKGTWRPNGQTMTIGYYSQSSTSVRDIAFGASAFVITGVGANVWYSGITTNLIFDPGTSTIEIIKSDSGSTTFAGGGLTYGDITVSGSGTGVLQFSQNNTYGVMTVLDRTSTTVADVRFLTGTTHHAKQFVWGKNVSITGNGGDFKLVTLN